MSTKGYLLNGFVVSLKLRGESLLIIAEDQDKYYLSEISNEDILTVTNGLFQSVGELNTSLELAFSQSKRGLIAIITYDAELVYSDETRKTENPTMFTISLKEINPEILCLANNSTKDDLPGLAELRPTNPKKELGSSQKLYFSAIKRTGIMKQSLIKINKQNMDDKNSQKNKSQK